MPEDACRPGEFAQQCLELASRGLPSALRSHGRLAEVMGLGAEPDRITLAMHCISWAASLPMPGGPMVLGGIMGSLGGIMGSSIARSWRSAPLLSLEFQSHSHPRHTYLWPNQTFTCSSRLAGSCACRLALADIPPRLALAEVM